MTVPPRRDGLGVSPAEALIASADSAALCRASKQVRSDDRDDVVGCDRTGSSGRRSGRLGRKTTNMANRPGHDLHRLLRRVEDTETLDPAAHALFRVARSTLARGPLRDVLTGTWLGHAFHPLLTDFAEGGWIAASFLDVFGPHDARHAAQRLVGFGLLAAAPTALTGLAEWADAGGKERRVGMVHAATSSAAFACYGWSYLARRRRKQVTAVAFGLIGGVIAFVDGYVAGRLSLALGVGVSQTAFAELPPDWGPTVSTADLPEDSLTSACAGGTEILLVRRGREVFALADRCTYRGGKLHEGELRGDAVVCPRDGCTFRLRDGAVVNGPASIPQPSLEARVIAELVEVRVKSAAPNT